MYLLLMTLLLLLNLVTSYFADCLLHVSHISAFLNIFILSAIKFLKIEKNMILIIREMLNVVSNYYQVELEYRTQMHTCNFTFTCNCNFYIMA